MNDEDGDRKTGPSVAGPSMTNGIPADEHSVTHEANRVDLSAPSDAGDMGDYGIEDSGAGRDEFEVVNLTTLAGVEFTAQIGQSSGSFDYDGHTCPVRIEGLSPAWVLAAPPEVRDRYKALHSELKIRHKSLTDAARRERWIREEEETLGVRAEAQSRHLKKQGEAEFSAQISEWAPVSMVDLLREAPSGAEPLVWMPTLGDELVHVLATCESVNRLAGGNKSGKSRLIAAYIYARVTGKPLLDFYQVKPAEPDAVIVVLDAEQSSSSAYVEWRAYLGELADDQQRRVVWVPLRGLSLNVFNSMVRDGIESMIRQTMVAQGVMASPDEPMPAIADLVFDPLFGFLPAGSDQIHDPTLATVLYNDVLVGWGQHRLGADNVWVNAHTSVAGGKTGAEIKIFGSVGFDSKFEALWYLQRKDQNDEGPRLFGAQPGRDDTFAPPVHVHLDRLTGRLYATPETMGEAYKEHKGATDRKSSADVKSENTDDRVLAFLITQTTEVKSNDVCREVKRQADADVAAGKAVDSMDYSYSKRSVLASLKRLRDAGAVEWRKDGQNHLWKLVTE